MTRTVNPFMSSRHEWHKDPSFNPGFGNGTTMHWLVYASDQAATTSSDSLHVSIQTYFLQLFNSSLTDSDHNGKRF